jgi:hypothetical protein
MGDYDMKAPYEPPVVVVHGSMEELTRTGISGVIEAASSSGNKKRNSLG